MAHKLFKNKLALGIAGIILVVALGIAANQFVALRKAHSSFANYYAFRGCTRLLQRTPDYGICKTAGGQTIKIVQFRGKWYLNNDLPFCVRNFCF